MFLDYSFSRDVSLVRHSIEYFPPDKIFSDIFESIIGAVAVDGGLSSAITTLKPILAPLVLFVAKYFR